MEKGLLNQIPSLCSMIINGRSPYVCGARDPRKIPLNQCVSLGDLMATLQRCKELDERDKTKNKKRKDKRQ